MISYAFESEGYRMKVKDKVKQNMTGCPIADQYKKKT